MGGKLNAQPELADDAVEIAAFIEERGITEVLHFTTDRGLLGVFATHYLKSRALLNEDQYLEHLFKPNVQLRRDARWVPYVSMSISRVNYEFFHYVDNWHIEQDLWWCVLSFEPEILTHKGTFFVTTNNIYTGAKREIELAGLQALFADRVHRYLSLDEVRYEEMPKSYTTCVQAEVLYPGQVDTQYLKRVYVTEHEHAATAEAQRRAVSHPAVEIIVDPEILDAP